MLRTSRETRHGLHVLLFAKTCIPNLDADFFYYDLGCLDAGPFLACKLPRASQHRYDTNFLLADVYESWALLHFADLALQIISASGNTSDERTTKLDKSLQDLTKQGFGLHMLPNVAFRLSVTATLRCRHLPLQWDLLGGSFVSFGDYVRGSLPWWRLHIVVQQDRVPHSLKSTLLVPGDG